MREPNEVQAGKVFVDAMVKDPATRAAFERVQVRLQLIGELVRAGYTFPQAVELVATLSKAPLN